MELSFSIGSIPAVLKRGHFLGGMKVVTEKEDVWLQHPLQPSTHFSLKIERNWQRTIEGHNVRIEKSRPALLAFARPHSYRVLVDGMLVAEARGF
ncbi:hypothetical protein [Undibacterium sp. RuTC16W]|uniref:hypothetical protein n=1 Tax=Undibacterium sp. RuTC16W TaxID=3413048 RepID=UPI003BF316F1